MAGPKRKIYRGGYQENHPEQMEYILDSSGTLPGHLLSVNTDEEFVKAAQGAYIYIANAPPCMDALTYEYEVGETAFGYVPRSRDVYLVRAVAGLTCVKDAPLYSNAAGQVTAVDPGSAQVVGYSHFEIATATAANDLIDMRIR
jgi:hypothetical protein